MRLHRYPNLFGTGGERGLGLAVLASAVLHVGLFAAFGRFHIAPVERTFLAPLHMVDLVAKAPGGGPKAEPAPKQAPKAEPTPRPPPPPAEKAPPKEAAKSAPKPPAPTQKPAEKVVPAAPKEPVAPKETPTEERVAESIARLREKLAAREPPAPAPAPAPARPGVGDAKVRQAVEAIRDRVKPGPGPTSGAPGPGEGPEGAVGPRGGRAGTVQDWRIQQYVNALAAHLQPFWQVPPSLRGGDLSTEIGVDLDLEGNVLKVRVERSSGSRAFDDVAVRALYRASPLPPPPDEIAREGLGFRLNEAGLE